MPSPPTSLVDEFGIAIGNLADAATGLFTPTLRLGVTGLSRAGKTVFITSLVHNLLTGGRLPGFAPVAGGRLIGAWLAEQPDEDVPRFAYEDHLAALTGTPPVWPQSTRRISELRLVLKFQSGGWLSGFTRPSQVNLDIVDYPGEWLLDLPLLSLSFAEWSAEALARAERPESRSDAKAFLSAIGAVDVFSDGNDAKAAELAKHFTAYLLACRADKLSLSTLPPGRFLMPGDLEGSPALTFAPLHAPDRPVPRNSLYALLERRYEAYKSLVIRPFFRDHFARLDRQIVLVDMLRALNAGPHAVADLELALTDILGCFRAGSTNLLSGLVAKKIDRIVFAASKADHLHHRSHDRLEAILNRLVSRASRRARFAGAETRSIALAAIRATHEDQIKDNGQSLDVIVGTPAAGETIDDVTYDGKAEIALFPGDLPENPDTALGPDAKPAGVRFLRFEPPGTLMRHMNGDVIFPHIRMDRALDYLLGDWMK